MQIRLQILLLCIAVWLPSSAAALTADICVVMSREIRPFLLMADELENSLKPSSQRVYLDAAYQVYDEKGNFLEIGENDFKLFVAVGPRALSYLLQHVSSTRIIYTMVLNPASFITGTGKNITGVSLNIFSLTQVSLIKDVFPGLKRIGVLYDPIYNQKWFNAAGFLAKARNLELVPLAVSDRSDISHIVDQTPNSVDAVLFIPDATVISTTIIQHVIKRLIVKKIPAIGYNSFFVEAGSAMSFVIDYEQMGRQVANEAHKLLGEKSRVSVDSLFNVVVNTRVIDLLGLQVNSRLPENVEFNQ